MNGTLVPWESAQTHVLTHTLHYGAGAFEGIRCYKTERGTAVFRLKEHMQRLLYSARAIKMDLPYTLEELMEAVVQTVKDNELEAGYIRPLMYYGYGKMGLNPEGAPVETIVACWPWGKYLAHDVVDVKISDYIRIHPKSTIADAKICGHYVNSIMAVQAIAGTKYHEAIFLDYNGNLAEGPGENLFLVKDGIIYTPSQNNILPGITRDTTISIAKELGLTVEEKVLTPEDAFAADEAFFTGTAAEVTGIGSINDHVFNGGEMGPVTKQIKDAYMDVVKGRNPKHDHYLTYIS